MTSRPDGRAGPEAPDGEGLPSGVLLLPGARLRSRGSDAPLVLMMALLATTAGAMVVLATDGVMSLVVLTILGLPMILVDRWRRQRVAGGQGVRADASGLWVAGRLALPRSELRRALVVVEEGTVLVAIQRSLPGPSGAEVVEGLSEPDAHALVQALGLDASSSTSEFVFDASPMNHVHPVAAWLYLLLPALSMGLFALNVPWWVLPVLLVGWYAGLLVSLWPRKVVVGLDGLLVSWLGRRRLVRYDELRAIEHNAQAVKLRMRDGSTLALRAHWVGQSWAHRGAKQTSGFGSQQAYLATAAARIREAQAASQHGATASASAWLSRGDRQPAQWVDELRQLLAHRGSFREGAPVADDLWATLEDQRQPGATRAAAAVALSPSLDESGRRRLRVAAATVVSPSLREALEASSGDDDEALLTALDQLDHHDPRGRSGR